MGRWAWAGNVIVSHDVCQIGTDNVELLRVQYVRSRDRCRGLEQDNAVLQVCTLTDTSTKTHITQPPFCPRLRSLQGEVRALNAEVHKLRALVGKVLWYGMVHVHIGFLVCRVCTALSVPQ